MAAEVLFAPPRVLSRSSVQALSPAESLVVVDIFINAAIACICHTRELIPWDSTCFRTRYIDDLKADFWKNELNKYSAFCDAEPSVQSVKSQEFRILKRGEDKRADGILDLIETGVFSAVEHGFLEAVRFFVKRGGTAYETTDVLESYTLNFDYNHGTRDGGSVRSVSFNSDHAFTTDITMKSFKRAIKSLLISLQGLPLMPRQRSLGVAMLYNNRCPSTFHTPLFRTEEVSLVAKEQSGWHTFLLQRTAEVGQFEVGHYRVVVGLSNITPSIRVPTSSQARDLKTSKQLQSFQKNSSQHRRDDLLSTMDDPELQDFHIAPATNRTRSYVCSPLPSSKGLPPSPTKKNSQRGPIPVMTRKNRKRNVVPEKLAELIVQACAIEANREEGHVFELEDLQQNTIIRLNTSLGSIMRCECGDEGNAGTLLLCSLCGTSQHMKCYGWDGFSPVKLPDEHFCYSCLLLPQETELDAQMPTLVRNRLALAYMKENDTSNADDLMHAMHLSNTEEDHAVFNDTLDRLQHDGYLARRGPEIMATMDEESTVNALRNFINPLAQISHHFYALKDRENERVRTNAIAAAVKEYTQGRAYLPDEHHADYEQVIAVDAFQKHQQRWGFYTASSAARKRKASSPPAEETPLKKTALARKASYHEGSPPSDATPPSYQLRKTSVTRNASLCEALVRLDRSSPSTVLSREEVLTEATNEATSDAQWEVFASGGGENERPETASIPRSTPWTTERSRR